LFTSPEGKGETWDLPPDPLRKEKGETHGVVLACFAQVTEEGSGACQIGRGRFTHV